MKSRYNLMRQSAVYDEVTLEYFPDPLSINFAEFEFTQPPYQYEVTESFITRPYVEMNTLYGAPELEDIVFNINNISHISVLTTTDTDRVLGLPEKVDMDKFFDVYIK